MNVFQLALACLSFMFSYCRSHYISVVVFSHTFWWLLHVRGCERWWRGYGGNGLSDRCRSYCWGMWWNRRINRHSRLESQKTIHRTNCCNVLLLFIWVTCMCVCMHAFAYICIYVCICILNHAKFKLRSWSNNTGYDWITRRHVTCRLVFQSLKWQHCDIDSRTVKRTGQHGRRRSVFAVCFCLNINRRNDRCRRWRSFSSA